MTMINERRKTALDEIDEAYQRLRSAPTLPALVDADADFITVMDRVFIADHYKLFNKEKSNDAEV